MGQINVDPNGVNERYKIKLADATHHGMIWEQAAEQCHNLNTELEAEVETLKKTIEELTRQNEALLLQTGRTDPELEGDEVE